MKNSFAVYQSSRLLRWGLIGAGLVLALALLSGLALPTYLKKTLEQQVQAQTGRQFQVGEVTFNPFTLTLNLTRLELWEADGKSTAFSADNLLIRMSPTSLVHRAPVVRELVLTHPELRLVRRQEYGKEVTNFSDVILRLAAQPGGGDPVRFSVSNIQLTKGLILWDDQIVKRQVRTEALSIGIPFISNFPAERDIFVEPQLSARINGSLFELKGKSKPFTDRLETQLAINLDRLDVTGLLAFSPKPLPLKVTSATLSTRLLLAFSDDRKGAQHGPHVTLSGTGSLNDIVLDDFSGAPLFRAREIRVAVQNADLLQRQVRLNALDVIDPHVWVSLDPRGVLNWMALGAGSSAKGASGNPPAEPAVPAEQGTAMVELAHFHLSQGTVDWLDAAHVNPGAPAMAMQIRQLAINAQNLSTSETSEPAKIDLSFGDGAGPQAHFEGALDPVHGAVSGSLSTSEIALATFQPYVDHVAGVKLSGRLGLQTHFSFQQRQFSVTELSCTMDDLALLTPGRQYGSMSARHIAVNNVSLDGESRHAKVEQVQLDQVQGDVFRDADGQINWMKIMARPGLPRTATLPHHPPGDQNSSPPRAWQTDISQIVLNGSHFSFGDKSVQPAVTLNADGVNAVVKNLSSAFDHPASVTLQATLNRTGKFRVDGSVEKSRFALNIDVQNFSAVALQPYFTDFLNITFERGALSTRGQLAWLAPAEVQFHGAFKLSNLASSDKGTSDDFLNWKLLDISGIDLDLGGKQPRIALGTITLNDFYARAILSEQGRLNLEDILVQPKSAVAAHGVATDETGIVAGSAPATVSASEPPQPGTGKTTLISVGQIALNNGVINYTDNFIRPHYSMRMTGMTGSIGTAGKTMNSATDEAVPISINGKVDDDAPLVISGTLNPLFNPILLDVRMTASGINLPNLTAYSAKYAGYALEKGKLSLDVEYHIKDNQLAANNSLKIDQLTFGDKVDSPDATHLPVNFIVSLLTDSNGQINLDLPISGTINDPQFSIGGLIFRVFINLVEKVVTSPFSLLAHAFSGGEELAYIEFAPGSAQLTDASKGKLDQLAKQLGQRASLKLDIIGRADMAADSSGLRDYLLAKRIIKMKAGAGSADVVTVNDVDRADAIDKIYAGEKFEKPRNAIGFAKSLPTAEMEKLIIANTVITDDDLRNLALKRESVVQNYLTDSAHIGADRLFLVAPKLSGSDIKDKGAVSRVDFDLKM